MSDYRDFLAAKAQRGADCGIEVAPEALHPALFPFQRDLTAWALRKGRAAAWADCGLGKTLMELVWADEIGRAAGRRVLILTPLAVTHQTLREAAKFTIDAGIADRGRLPDARTVVTNYERLHHLRPEDFCAVVCDESSILKSFEGVRRGEITAFMRQVPYRLLACATPAPNDYTEVGTSSEALGYLGNVDMLNRFFANDRNNSAQGRAWGKAALWRFKGHAEVPFWRWVCSWARALRRPSDLGYDDGQFVLPPLVERQHFVTTTAPPAGYFMPVEAVTMFEQREEQRRTLAERCERAAELLADGRPGIAWCHLNDEGDLLERLIPGAVQVSGADPDEAKEEKLLAFVAGQARVLVSKPRVAGFGLNLQHCAHQTFFPSHSFEEYYQAVRRCWRFGQKQPVTVDVVTTEGASRVLASLQAKTRAADAMLSRLVALMNDGLRVATDDSLTESEVAPPWLHASSC